jgi:hypothetical protein
VLAHFSLEFPTASGQPYLTAGTGVCYNDRGAASFPSAHGLFVKGCCQWLLTERPHPPSW